MNFTSLNRNALAPPTLLDEIPDVLGDGIAGNVAPGLNLLGELPRNIISLMFQRVDGHHANRRVELSGHEVGDHRLKVGALDLGVS
jgi:hypothetical protein